MSDDLEERVDQLESDVEFWKESFFDLQDIVLGEIGPAAADTIVSKKGGILERLENGVEDQQERIDRDKLLPLHNMWIDIREGREDTLRSDNARRAARLFRGLIRRAAGDPEVKVDVTDKFYVIDSGQAEDTLVAASDITDGGVSKTITRVFEAMQRFTKVKDCGCDSIATCDHGLVVFDDSSRPNRVRAEKRKLEGYLKNVQQAAEETTTADDDGEQPSEAPAPADASTSDVEAVEAEFDQLLTADGGDGVSDTVVSNVESKASDRPVPPKPHQDR